MSKFIETWFMIAFVLSSLLARIVYMLIKRRKRLNAPTSPVQTLERTISLLPGPPGQNHSLPESAGISPLPPDPEAANSPNSRLPAEDSSMLAIQRAILESFAKRIAQPEPEVIQVDGNSPLFDLGRATTTQEDVTAERPTSEPATLDPDSIITTAAHLAPYTYQPPNSTSATPLEANIPSEQSQLQISQSPEEPQMGPIPYPYRIPEEVENLHSNSIAPPSEISFEDSLLPPEYNSAWGGEHTA